MQKMKSAKMIRRPRHKPHDILYIYIQTKTWNSNENTTRKMGLIPHAKWDFSTGQWYM